MTSVVVHYQEIALKGKNRPWFIARLVNNIRHATSDLDIRAVRPLVGRIELVLGPAATYEQVRERLARVFGIANFSKAARTPLDIEAIASAILRDLGDLQVPSFRVTVKRADKRFPMKSPEIEREVGGRIKLAKGWRVDLDEPELTISVEMLTNEAFYTFAKEHGAGGLPTGVSGTVACLMSGGIDSPVAAWRMMKRGCSAILVHFHSYPFLSRASQEKVRELAQLLTTYQQRTRLFLVAFGEIQRQVVLTAPAPLRIVIYRRLMMRIAERIANENGARALVTGEVDRTGRLPDAREHVAHRVGDEPARPAAAGRDGQGGDRRAGRPPRQFRDLDRARPGLLPAVHPEAPGDAGETLRGRRGGEPTANRPDGE